MIIDKTYFQGNLNIPNVQEDFVPLGDRGGNQSNLDEYILKYEKLVMQNALGYEAWKSFIASFDTNTGDLLPGADQRWKDLVDGKEYTNKAGVLVKWEGLRYTLGTFKYSLIADYVFSIFLNDTSRTFAGNGMVKEKANTAETFSSIPRIAEAYNGFVTKYQGDALGEYPVVRNKGNLLSIDYSNRMFTNMEVSMYQFLAENDSDYEDVVFRFYSLTNSFGI